MQYLIFLLILFSSAGASLAFITSFTWKFRNKFLHKLATCSRCQSFWISLTMCLLLHNGLVISIIVAFTSYLTSHTIIDYFNSIKIKFK